MAGGPPPLASPRYPLSANGPGAREHSDAAQGFCGEPVLVSEPLWCVLSLKARTSPRWTGDSGRRRRRERAGVGAQVTGLEVRASAHSRVERRREEARSAVILRLYLLSRRPHRFHSKVLSPATVAVLQGPTGFSEPGARTPRVAKGRRGGRLRGGWRTRPVCPLGLENFFLLITSPNRSARVARRAGLALFGRQFFPAGLPELDSRAGVPGEVGRTERGDELDSGAGIPKSG